jgi:ribonuclease P protein subunit POP4
MRITPDIVRTEFIGARALIAQSPNMDYMGLAGKVIEESKNTFTILSEGKSRRIIKDTCIFDFTLSDNSVVEIDGKLLVGRSEDRLKKSIKRLW